MNSWNPLNDNEYFISDLGPFAAHQGLSAHPPRFAVWRNAVSQQQMQLVEVGDTLSSLQEKYHIPSERVAVVGV